MHFTRMIPTVLVLQPLKSATLFLQFPGRVPVLTLSGVTSKPTTASTPSRFSFFLAIVHIYKLRLFIYLLTYLLIYQDHNAQSPTITFLTG